MLFQRSRHHLAVQVPLKTHHTQFILVLFRTLSPDTDKYGLCSYHILPSHPFIPACCSITIQVSTTARERAHTAVGARKTHTAQPPSTVLLCSRCSWSTVNRGLGHGRGETLMERKTDRQGEIDGEREGG